MIKDFFKKLKGSSLLPFLFFLLVSCCLWLSLVLNEDYETDIPFSVSILNVPEGDGSPSFFSVKFYLVAILFLVFDLEVIFLYPWALGFQDVVMNNGEAFAAMTAFIGVLMVAYLYAVGKGAIVWHRNPAPRR